MELYVLRHAIAVDRGTPGYDEDSERPITDEGRRKLKKSLRAWRALDVDPDVIVCSPYVRARQTAETVARELDYSRDIVYTDTLTPESAPDAVLKFLTAEHDGATSVLVVGHEPHLGHFISYALTGGTRLHLNLKKGGLCRLTAQHLGTPEQLVTLDWLLTPGQMKRVG